MNTDGHPSFRLGSAEHPGGALDYGTCWYPEHRAAATWDADLALMAKAGMTVIRICEFAWSRLEPEDGRFDFGWGDAALAAAARHGLVAVIGTPSAGLPIWLSESHPEVVRVEMDGRRCGHGARGHFNPASAVYLRYCARIASAMAARWGRDPRVIGWQIDNEYWPFSYDEETRRGWADFLRRRFADDIAALNQAWSNVYWSQDYQRFDQVPMRTDWQNPCLVAALREYQSQVIVAYQRNQIDAIRPHLAPGVWVTHNLHGHLQHGNPLHLAADLDFPSYDPYVGQGHLDHTAMGAMLDAVRGLGAQRRFWVTETQPAMVNWARINTALSPGESRRMVLHQVGHGAEAVLWWQWRPAHGGQEQFHGSLLHADGRPRPFFSEAVAIGRDLAALRPHLAGRAPRTRIAVLSAWNDRHAIDAQRHHADFDPWAHIRAWHAALRRTGHAVDIVDPSTDLGGYALAVAPGLFIADDRLSQRLATWVADGGHLLLGARCGVKDEHNALRQDAPPGGALAAALGATVGEAYALADPVPFTDLPGSATIWGEWIDPVAADLAVHASFGPGGGWLASRPAWVSRAHGRGRIGLFAAWPDSAADDAVVAHLLADAGLTPAWPGLPPTVEACPRGACTLLLNHGAASATLDLPTPMRDLLSGGEPVRRLDLPGGGCAALIPA